MGCGGGANVVEGKREREGERDRREETKWRSGPVQGAVAKGGTLKEEVAAAAAAPERRGVGAAFMEMPPAHSVQLQWRSNS